MLVFVRLFRPYTQLDQWPGLYVGSIVVPKTVSGRELRQLCQAWLGLHPPHDSIRLFSLRSAKRCLLIDDNETPAASLSCGSTLWIQPDFMLTDTERAALGVVSPSYTAINGAQLGSMAADAFRSRSPNGPCDLGTPSSDDENVRPQRQADSPVPDLNRFNSLDSAATEVYELPDDTPEAVVTEPPVVLQKATISFPDWLAHEADVVEVDVSPLTNSEFGAKIGFQSTTASKDASLVLWDFEMKMRLPKSARGHEIVSAIAAELAKHPEVFELVDFSKFSDSQFPRDFIRLSTSVCLSMLCVFTFAPA